MRKPKVKVKLPVFNFLRKKSNEETKLKFREATVEGEITEDLLDVSISSEEPVTFEKYNSAKEVWEEWQEVLDHEEKSVDLDRANTNAPVLYNHNRDTVIGKIEKAYIKDKKVRATIRLSAADHVKGYVQQIKEGCLSNMSIGYWVKQYKEEFDNKVMRAVEWGISEASIVGQPADLTVGIGRSENETVDENKLGGKGGDDTREVTLMSGNTEQVEPTRETSGSPNIETREDNSEIVKQERDRAKQIRSLCSEFAVDETTTEKMIDEGFDLARANDAVLKIIATRKESAVFKDDMAVSSQVPM